MLIGFRSRVRIPAADSTPAIGILVFLSRTTPVSARPGGMKCSNVGRVDRLAAQMHPGGDDTFSPRRVITSIVALWIVGPSMPIWTIRSRPMPVNRNRPSASVTTD